ncbi:hypothetical protein, partial [Hymenobacter lapidiphilus]
FRAIARKWIAANAPKEFEEELSKSSLGRIRLAKHDMVEVGKADEIMRNIIAERVLGLPGDIRVDKDVPFNKIPTKGRA